MKMMKSKIINFLKEKSVLLLPYDSKIRVFVKIILQLLKNPRQALYYMNPRKMLRVLYYWREGGVNNVARILDERILMGADLKLELKLLPAVSGKNIQDYSKFQFKKIENPLVSIIIPVYNKFDFTYNCLKSIYLNSGNIDYEIIIADDCSTDFTRNITDIISNIRVIRTKENSLFLKNCNHAASFAQGKYLLFLNNDTQVQENWLEPLISVLENNSDVALTGSKLVYPDGRLQEAGGILWKDGSAWNYGNGKNPALPEYNYLKEVDYISGASILIKKDVWNQLGGFDEQFAPAYCEDSDLAFSVRQLGYKVIYQPLSVVVHFEGISNGKEVSTGIKSYQVINQEKFYQKWKNVLETEHLENGRDVFLARDRSQSQKRILIIDHRVPLYDKDAGAKNVFMYTQMFLDMGLKVTFMPDNYYPYQPYTKELEQMGVEVLYGNYYFKYWREWLKDNVHYFDYIYVNRPHVAVKYMDLLKEYTKGEIIYFGHDLHFLREKRQYEYDHKKETLESAEKWKRIESGLINKADVVYVVGNYEYEFLRREYPNKILRNIPIFTYDPNKMLDTPTLGGRHDLLFVGGFSHPPNIDAVLWFAKEVFPKILEHYPNIVWNIVGSNPTEEIVQLESEHIKVKGFVPDDELIRMYKETRLVVVPLRYGAGVKGKVVESIYYQVPLITTPIGAEGLETNTKVFVVAEADEKMADSIIELYDNDAMLEELIRNCKKFISNNFTKEKALEILQKDILI